MENLDKEKLITVFKSGHEGLIALAKSVLDEAGIEYLIKNEGVQDLMGIGVFGTGFNPITGPVQIQVLPSNEEYAKDLLKNMVENTDISESTEEEPGN
ncbi:MAG: DUF2007 domain-containing protein [Ignavibacteria bacterium]|nr:DUF2007 domain-containing protein [Ignavibacteria bacterium]